MSVLESVAHLFKCGLGRTAMTLLAGALLALSATPADAQWTTNGNDINNTNSGNVGVGTSSPSSRLTVVGPVQNGVYTVRIDSTAGGQAGSQNGILLIGTSATTYLSAGATTIKGSAPHLEINAVDNSNFTATLGNTGGLGRVLRMRSTSSSNIPVMQVEGSNGGTVTLSALVAEPIWRPAPSTLSPMMNTVIISMPFKRGTVRPTRTESLGFSNAAI